MGRMILEAFTIIGVILVGIITFIIMIKVPTAYVDDSGRCVNWVTPTGEKQQCPLDWKEQKHYLEIIQ